ncbi:sensor histidine kinase [Sphingomonas sp. ac-8]|uniref:sensor histidine kinase n=1 Tax=Sphingomonas sp. ac-8 TaxID=3242977 RepID=UPI003A80AA76
MKFPSRLSLTPGIAAMLLIGTAAAGVTGGAALGGALDTTPIAQVMAPGPRAVAEAGTHASLADMVQAVGASVVQIQVKPQARMQQMAGPYGGGDLQDRLGQLFEPVAEDKGVTLTAAISPATVTGARSLLAQAAANLIDNAVKNRPTGGRVRVALEREGATIRLVVSDMGPGIPADLRKRALTRFARLDASRSQPGSGIGLSIVAVAARVHRAALHLGDARPGLCVELVFPAAGEGPVSG